MFNYGQSPRFSPSATFIQIDIDHATLDSSPRPDIAVLGDAATVLDQITRAVDSAGLVLRFAPWRSRLQQRAESSSAKHEHWLSSDDVPIHPLRLCREIRDFIPRDAVLVVDGQEILNYARQSIPSFMPAHRLNSGPFGTMGVGIPFGIGAKVARGEELVVVLTGDGAFGMNGMELDTAIRHALPVLVVVSLNGGWTADPDHSKPGRDLGYTRYDKVAEALGCHAEFVEQPGDIRPALDRAAAAVAKGQSAVVNVVTDWRARSETVAFTQYMT